MIIVIFISQIRRVQLREPVVFRFHQGKADPLVSQVTLLLSPVDLFTLNCSSLRTASVHEFMLYSRHFYKCYFIDS